MPDIFKTFVKHMDGVNKAAVADAAAQAMAEHCDSRIEKAKAALREIIDECQRGPPQGLCQVIAIKARKAIKDLG